MLVNVDNRLAFTKVYCGGGAMAARKAHNLETTFDSFVRNQLSQFRDDFKNVGCSIANGESVR